MPAVKFPSSRRRHASVLALLAGLTLATGSAWAQGAEGYPARPITFVVPFTAGSGPDALVRALARDVARQAGVATLVDNKPGAGSVLAAQAVARSPADGHTLLVTGNVAMTGNPHVMRRPGYDPVTDFTPVTTLVHGPMLLYVNAQQMPRGGVRELLATMKAAPGRTSYGYTSITSRLPAELLQQGQGVAMVGVPYRSGAAALPDLIAGQIHLLFTDLSAWPHVQSGKLRALAVTDTKRSPLAPDVPTFDELGVRDLDVGFWLAAYLPAKAPASLVQKLHGWLSDAVRSAEARQAMRTFGTTEFVLPVGELAPFQAREREAWGRAIRAAGIEAE